MTISKDLEQRLESIEQNASLMMNEINKLRNIDLKLDQLNAISLEIKNSALKVGEKIQKQEQFLEEIKIGAEFRKRESENSVREIKTQMSDMELHSEISLREMIDKFLKALKESELAQKESIADLKNTFNNKLLYLEQKTDLNFKLSITAIAISIFLALFIFY